MDGVVAAAVAGEVGEHAEPEAERRHDPAPAARVERHPRPDRDTFTPGTPASSPSGHWRSVR